MSSTVLPIKPGTVIASELGRNPIDYRWKTSFYQMMGSDSLRYLFTPSQLACVDRDPTREGLIHVGEICLRELYGSPDISPIGHCEDLIDYLRTNPDPVQDLRRLHQMGITKHPPLHFYP